MDRRGNTVFIHWFLKIIIYTLYWLLQEQRAMQYNNRVKKSTNAVSMRVLHMFVEVSWLSGLYANRTDEQSKKYHALSISGF